MSHLALHLMESMSMGPQKDEYQKQMAAKIREADDAAREQVTVTLTMSRQEYRDLLEAYKFLRQINPWLKSVGVRLERLAVKAREALDREDRNASRS